MKKFPTKTSSTKIWFPIGTLMEEIKLAKLHNLGDLDKSKALALLKISEYHDSNAEKK